MLLLNYKISLREQVSFLVCKSFLSIFNSINDDFECCAHISPSDSQSRNEITDAIIFYTKFV